MGIFRKILAEGKDLASVVDGIKKAVLNFKAHQDQEEALFRKELGTVEDQAQRALSDIAKVLDKHKGVLEAMYDDRWTGQVNPKLAECGQAVMGLMAPLAEMCAPKKEGFDPDEGGGTKDCKACKGSGLTRGKDCEDCSGTGAIEPEPVKAGRDDRFEKKTENKKAKK